MNIALLQTMHNRLYAFTDPESMSGILSREEALTLQSDPYFDGDETQAQLQEAIGQLPARQRQVFMLKYYDEMKYEDMSQVLGTSVGALKASYHHAVKKICNFFDQLD